MAKFGDYAVGDIVKLNVNGVAIDFIIVNQGLPSSDYDSSCDGTWLLMKDIYEERAWCATSPTNSYQYSDIHKYLEGDFLSLFDSDIQNAIKEVKLPRKLVESSQYIDYTLTAKIFLLSITETDYIGTNPEGAALQYFDSMGDARRIAQYNGTDSSWWTASIGGDTLGARAITRLGRGGSFEQTRVYGIRPALILPSYFELPSNFNGKATIGGVQRDLTAAHVNIGGAWKELSNTYMNIGGTWKSMN